MRAAILLFSLFAAQAALAADEVVLSAKQIESLGIVTERLPDRHGGELAGMPAQVVIPANKAVVISAPLPAAVREVGVGVGDHVARGQVLAHLESPALAEAERGFLEAAAQEQLASSTLARDEQLLKEGIISESRYRAALSQHASASAALAERRQMLKLAGIGDGAIGKLKSAGNLSSQLEITSPIEGVVLERNISAGQRLDAAAPLFRVGKTGSLALEIQVPLSATDDLAVGAPVSIPAFNAQGKLIAIGRSLSGANQTILLRAIVLEGSENLRPGQYVEASIATSRVAARQWDIPNSAIARISGKPVVFVATPKGFRAAAVSVLHEGARHSVVTGSFNGDEMIAVQGVSSLKASLTGVGSGD